MRVGQPHDAAVVEVAHELGTTEAQVELAWLLAAGPNVLPTVGSTRVASIADSAAIAMVALSPAVLASLDRGLPPRSRTPATWTPIGNARSGWGCRIATRRSFLGREDAGSPSRSYPTTPRTTSTTFATLSPSFSDTTLPGALAPNRSMPTLAPSPT